eukprot:705696-Alexandrium_andersonii.AAC.1
MLRGYAGNFVTRSVRIQVGRGWGFRIPRHLWAHVEPASARGRLFLIAIAEPLRSGSALLLGPALAPPWLWTGRRRHRARGCHPPGNFLDFDLPTFAQAFE